VPSVLFATLGRKLLPAVFLLVYPLPQAFAGYTYYYSSSAATFQSPNWIPFGNISVGNNGSAVNSLSRQSGTPGGLISNLMTGPGEVKLTVAFSAPDESPAYTVFFNVTPGFQPTNCGQSPASWYEVRIAGYVSVYRCDSGIGYALVATAQASIQDGSQIRAIRLSDGSTVVYVDNFLVLAAADIYTPLPPGFVGVGVQNVFSPNAITEADLGPLDTIAPNAIAASSISVAGFPDHVNLEWPAATDDPNGTGVAFYLISRDSKPLAFQTNLSYSDIEVFSGVGYTYTITVFTYHLTVANTSVSTRTPLFFANHLPTIAKVANGASESPMISANTWVEIDGTGLAPGSRAWQTQDFVDNQMPTVLDGVSVTLNNENAFVSYISGGQINVLAPPDLAPGPVQVEVINNGVTSGTFTAQAQAHAPSFFVFSGGPYIVATHADGSLIGPASLYPGLTTPAEPGEIVVLYATGFGPTSDPIVPGAPSQSGTLPALPAVQIGGLPSAVSFAGLIGPGEFQFNVTVPLSIPAGDSAVTAVYRGASVQTGTLLTIAN
jgi:uncharacterized protein (TIGR03437 family)